MKNAEDAAPRSRGHWFPVAHRRARRGVSAREALDTLRAQAVLNGIDDACPDDAVDDAPPALPVERGLRADLRRRFVDALPVRLILHGVVVVLVSTVLLGEWGQAWSLQTLMPWNERMAVAGVGGGVAPLPGDAIPAVMPFNERLEESVAARDLAPGFEKPIPLVDAFHELHQLAAGETLGQLAAEYNVSLDSLIWANDLQSGDVLMLGQPLRIPRVSGMPYVIRKNDTLDAIAARFGVTADDILLFEPNKLQLDAPLPVGKEIFVPRGSQPLPEALLALRGGTEGLAQAKAQTAGLVVEPQTNLRSGPGQMYPRVAQLEAGRRAQLLGRYKQWLKIDVAGTTGWVRTDLLETAPGLVDELPETEDFPPPPPVWVWPARGALTSYFGPRWGSFHNGLDIANRAWSPILAARAGTVIEAGWCRGYGYCVKINHSGGVQTIYGHLIDQPVVSAGEEVAAGQLIGHMGSTYDRAGGGFSTGVHLHFTVTVNGRAVDPLKFLP